MSRTEQGKKLWGMTPERHMMITQGMSESERDSRQRIYQYTEILTSALSIRGLKESQLLREGITLTPQPLLKVGKGDSKLPVFLTMDPDGFTGFYLRFGDAWINGPKHTHIANNLAKIDQAEATKGQAHNVIAPTIFEISRLSHGGVSDWAIEHAPRAIVNGNRNGMSTLDAYVPDVVVEVDSAGKIVNKKVKVLRVAVANPQAVEEKAFNRYVDGKIAEHRAQINNLEAQTVTIHVAEDGTVTIPQVDEEKKRKSGIGILITEARKGRDPFYRDIKMSFLQTLQAFSSDDVAVREQLTTQFEQVVREDVKQQTTFDERNQSLGDAFGLIMALKAAREIGIEESESMPDLVRLFTAVCRLKGYGAKKGLESGSITAEDVAISPRDFALFIAGLPLSQQHKMDWSESLQRGNRGRIKRDLDNLKGKYRERVDKLFAVLGDDQGGWDLNAVSFYTSLTPEQTERTYQLLDSLDEDKREVVRGALEKALKKTFEMHRAALDPTQKSSDNSPELVAA